MVKSNDIPIDDMHTIHTHEHSLVMGRAIVHQTMSILRIMAPMCPFLSLAPSHFASISDPWFFFLVPDIGWGIINRWQNWTGHLLYTIPWIYFFLLLLCALVFVSIRSTSNNNNKVGFGFFFFFCSFFISKHLFFICLCDFVRDFYIFLMPWIRLMGFNKFLHWMGEKFRWPMADNKILLMQEI